LGGRGSANPDDRPVHIDATSPIAATPYSSASGSPTSRNSLRCSSCATACLRSGTCPSIAPVDLAMLPPEPIRPARGGAPLLLRLPSTTWRTLSTAGCQPHSYAARLIEEKVREGLGVDPRAEAAVDVRWGRVSPGDPNGGKMRDAGVALGRSRGRCPAARDHYSGQIASLGSRWGGRRTVDLVRVLAR
jgi:hypothetical protein